MIATDPDAGAAVAHLQSRLRQVHRHATWIERLAASVGAAGSFVAFVLVLAAPGILAPAVLGALGALCAWALLRALALALHLRADEAAVALTRRGTTP